MKFPSFLPGLIVFLATLVITVSCTASAPPISNPSPNAELAAPIRIGYSAWPGFFPLEVAERENLLKNSGSIQLKWFYNYSDSIKAFKENKLDANFQSLVDTLVLSANNGLSDRVVILVSDNSLGSDKIIARRGINKLPDLKGKTIAVEKSSIEYVFVLFAFNKIGLKPADVKFKDLDTASAGEAFLAGDVDAVVSFDPFAEKALARSGSKVILTSKNFPGLISDHLVVTRQLIEERPQELQAFINSWFTTLEYIHKNPKDSYEIIAKKAGMSVENYKKLEAGVKIFSLEDNLKAFQLSQEPTSLPKAATQLSQFLLKNGLIQKQPDLSHLFDDRFVKAHATARAKQ